jgi:hypothetical protein
MNSIIDKIEASISIEWHLVRGLNYNKKAMELKPHHFAISCTPFLGEKHYEDENAYKGYEAHPYIIKYLFEEERYDVPVLNPDAPRGTSIWQNKNDLI